MKSVIRLFRAVPIKTKDIGEAVSLLEKTVKEGFLFSPEVIGNYPIGELEKLLNEVAEEIGFNARQTNASFHKSWKKVKEASIEELVTEQIIHYLTTYGLESLGIYNEDYVYIPAEELSLPPIDIDKIQLTVIKGLTKEVIKEKLLALVNSGIALHEDTLKDIVDVALYIEISEEEIVGLKSKEVKATLYDLLGIVPKNATEFLRYIVYKATDSALLIKSPVVIEKIKERKNLDVLVLFIKYRESYGLEPLAEIFYRFKPLFLAFKTNIALNKIINKIRKLAIKNHKPMPEDYLNEITPKIQNGEYINLDTLSSELARVNVFRRIRLAYALKFRTSDADAILYRIRNGKAYATEFEIKNKAKADEILDIVMDSISEQITKNVRGKTIYIPESITYALPATEKQFTGMFPSGTCISIPRDMIFGVHWENVKNHRIDLDLSLISADAKFGWDGDYRNDDRTLLFSGDMTDAPKPHGASELFYIKRQQPGALLVMLNYFNFKEEVEVPIQIFVAQEQAGQMTHNYTVNPNNMIAMAQSAINQKQKLVGLVVTTETECRFYFSETYVGRAISSSSSKVSEHIRKYLYSFYSNTISLNEMLIKAGAKITTDKSNCDIDLSPTNLNKDSIINLIK